MNEPMFPILNDPIIRAIPWAAIAPHEKQAGINHSQTLRGLAGRGGLDVVEAVLILLDKPWPRDWKPLTEVGRAEYRRILMLTLREFEKSRAALAAQEPKP